MCKSLRAFALVLAVSSGLAMPRISWAQAPSPDPTPDSTATHVTPAPVAPKASQQLSDRSTPPPKGLGMIVGGSALATFLGLPLTLLGFVGLAATETVDMGAAAVGAPDTKPATNRSRAVIIGGCIVPGVLTIAGGTAMVIFGSRRLSRYSSWKKSNANAARGFTLSPMVASTRLQTGVLGFQGRF